MEEETLPTPYEKIKIFTGNGLPSTGMEPYLEALRHICERRDVPGHRLVLLPRKQTAFPLSGQVHRVQGGVTTQKGRNRRSPALHSQRPL